MITPEIYELELDTEDEHFVVDDMMKADWVVSKIMLLQEKMAKEQKQAKEYKAAIDESVKKKVEAWTAEIDRYSSMLAPYVNEQTAGTKKKSVNFPSGVVAGFQKQQPSFYINGAKVDGKSADLLNFVENTDDYRDYIIINKTVDWSSLKRKFSINNKGNVVSEDGEIVPGMMGVKNADKFYVRLEAKESEK